ncbi:hypothetical protein A3H16_03345 [Candidatus Kaiserbacteria bacterium RIFCSPLOWO2_12_FULL_53_8]|uniref:Uncharacterized protein n=2 Tax=Candidatus Kaiseribacteriota TaxID=1752734 RepID=A0A1F6CX29_9BACT|nr:MAG: hypothetical protein A2851_05620 [Candidatus Kaiserbacteria bacterium RIFCSPHIGHO2_01_FULL_53_29]OGG91827.1 MAG: hypothetical protein A3H16_03345 [Candidatus Kaiserbacteria bacterium RIFCSPLOWO2_12_FULL_53_8]
MKYEFNKILLAAVIVLAIGEGYLIYQTNGKKSVENGAALPASAETKDAAPIPPSTILRPLSGEVAEVKNGSLILKSTIANGATPTISLSVGRDAVIVAQGARKSQSEIDADMEDFRQSSFDLASDIKKNVDALRRLIAPSPYEERKIALSDVEIGQNITAYVEEQNGNGDWKTFKITVLPAAAR